MEQLVSLQERTEQAIVPLAYPRERRPYSPHLTLGRVREGEKTAGWGHAAEGDGCLGSKTGRAVASRRGLPDAHDASCPAARYTTFKRRLKLTPDGSWHQR